jgi:hypothetical protein
MHLDYLVITIIVATVIAGCWPLFFSEQKSRRAKVESEDESTIILTRKESLWLLDLLENPPPMNDKLKALMEKYDKQRKDGSDSSFEWDKGATPQQSGDRSDTTHSAILEQVEALRQEISTLQSEMRAEFTEVKIQLGRMSQQ